MPLQMTCASALRYLQNGTQNCIFHSNAVFMRYFNSTSCLISIFLTHNCMIS